MKFCNDFTFIRFCFRFTLGFILFVLQRTLLHITRHVIQNILTMEVNFNAFFLVFNSSCILLLSLFKDNIQKVIVTSKIIKRKPMVIKVMMQITTEAAITTTTTTQIIITKFLKETPTLIMNIAMKTK